MRTRLGAWVWRLTIARKFTALSSSLVLITAASIAVIVVRSETAHGRATLANHGRNTAQLLAKNAEYALYTEDFASLPALVSLAEADSDVAYVVVATPDGRDLVERSKPGLSRIPARRPGGPPLEAVRGTLDTMVRASDGRSYLEILAPVLTHPEADASAGSAPSQLLGHVRVGLSTEPVQRKGREFMLAVLAVTIPLAALGVGLTVLLARRITAPMEHLREVARDIGAGRLDLRADVGGTVEVVELERAFNAMLEEIHRSHLELENRAADLTVANAQLVEEVEERAKVEQALRRSEERYALAARAANDGLWDWDLEKSEIYFSPRWKVMLGLSDEEVGGRVEDWLDRVHPEDAPQLRREIDDHLAGRTEQLHSLYRMAHPRDGVRWMLCRGLTVRDGHGRALRLAGSQSDVTGQKRAEERLVHDALHDALTGLPNRSLFMDRLGHAVSLATEREARGRRRGFAVLFIDLDRFKLVNDTLGHSVGDHLLIEVARRITTGLRSGDSAARLGGDEFAILLEDIDSVVDAEAIAERVLGRIGEPLEVSGQTLCPGASVGVVIQAAEPRSAEEILRNADIAMYRAKRSGGRHAVFEASMRSEAVERLSLESELRRALERREFELHYQPILDIGDGSLTGFEALLRWRHPTRGVVPPQEFLPVLEETRLIRSVGRWLLEEACRQVGLWRAERGASCRLRVSVNISSVQFAQSSFVQEVREALATTGLPPWCLALEITESAILENTEAAARMLEDLHTLGVQIHLDDFGTGYSSLAYLARFPIDCLKIDRSFISRMKHHRADMEIVRAIAAIAHNLDMEVIGEGIESPDEVAALLSAGCRLGQGWLYSRALPPEEASRLVGSRDHSPSATTKAQAQEG